MPYDTLYSWAKHLLIKPVKRGRHSGLMVSALDSVWSSPGSSPDGPLGLYAEPCKHLIILMLIKLFDILDGSTQEGSRKQPTRPMVD